MNATRNEMSFKPSPSLIILNTSKEPLIFILFFDAHTSV